MMTEREFLLATLKQAAEAVRSLSIALGPHNRGAAVSGMELAKTLNEIVAEKTQTTKVQ